MQRSRAVSLDEAKALAFVAVGVPVEVAFQDAPKRLKNLANVRLGHVKGDVAHVDAPEQELGAARANHVE